MVVFRTNSTQLLVISLLGILVRLLFLQHYVVANPFYAYPILDAAMYLDWAEHLLAGKPYFVEEYHHPVGYAVFLAGVFRLFPHNLYAVLFVQSLLVAVQGWLVFLCAKRFFGAPAAWVAFALFSLCGPVAFYAMKVLSETLYTALLLAAFYCLVRYEQRQGLGTLALAGLLLGAAAEVRGNALVCLVPAAVTIVGHTAGGKRLVALGTFLGALALCVLPVLARNVAVTGAWAPVSSNWGENFYFANNPEATGSFGVVTGIGTNLQAQIRDVQQEASRRAGRALSAREAQRFWMAAGLRFIATHPGAWVRLELRKLQRLLWWREASSMYLYELESRWFQPALLLLFVDYGLLVPLCFCGGLAVRLRGIVLLLGFLVAQGLVLLIFWPELRFLLPLIPFMAMLSGNVLHQWRATRVRWGKLLPVLAGLLLWLVANVVPVHGTGGREAWYTNAATALFTQGDYARALTMAQQAIAIQPTYADAWVNLGAALARSGRVGEARQAWLRARELHPDDLITVCNLARSFEAEDREIALVWWRTALAVALRVGTTEETLAEIRQHITDLSQP